LVQATPTQIRNDNKADNFFIFDGVTIK
jgi:hypothetical protein